MAKCVNLTFIMTLVAKLLFFWTFPVKSAKTLKNSNIWLIVMILDFAVVCDFLFAYSQFLIMLYWLT